MPHREVKSQTRSNARRMRKALTGAELKLWNELRAHRLMGLGFRRQMPVGKYIADFACPEHKLIVELDGSQHNEPAAEAYDAKRTGYLQSQGWTVLRYWNDEVLRNINEVCNGIVNHLMETGVEFR